MKAQTKVILEKLTVSDNPKVETSKIEDYIPGQDNGAVSVPTGFWVQGTLISDVEVGKSVSIFRTTRNGINTYGYTITSPVISLRSDGLEAVIETENSVYKLTNMSD